MADKDFYVYLGITYNSTPDEIKSAYRKKLFECHPDHGGSSEQMIELNYVYETLSDPVQRKNYDSTRGYYSSHKKQSKKDPNKKSEPHRSKKDTYQNQDLEDYSDAVFVDGIEALDSYGNSRFINLYEYLYYPVRKKRSLLLWNYYVNEYYRAKIIHIYSQKRNTFKKNPLFVVSIDSLEQVIFKEDFARYWMNEDSFKMDDRKKANFTIVKWLVGIALVVLLILFITNRENQTYSSNVSSQGECVVKGNISSSGEKIYHVPGQRYYKATEIESDEGERWFCTEKLAQDAGWRKSKE